MNIENQEKDNNVANSVEKLNLSLKGFESKGPPLIYWSN